MLKEIISLNPTTNQVVWKGNISDEAEVNLVVSRAKTEQIYWKDISLSERKNIVLKFAEIVKTHSDEAAKLISEENGKPLWEAKGEVNSLINKVQVVLDAYEERAKGKTKELANGRVSVTRYLPHGVMAVLGPFNFPMSMPNSHIMPALYAGNTIVFKPSERTPKAALYYRDMWIEAGLPKDALQIVQGDYTVGEMLVNHKDINGVLFIGSRKAGKAIEKSLVSLDKIGALEMGGNSPLVVWDYGDVRAAINITIQSAYISSGQRCSAARRLIVNKSIYDEFINELSCAIKKIVVGNPLDSTTVPFMGPMIDKKAVGRFMSDYRELIDLGAKVLVSTENLHEIGDNFVRPALVDVSKIEVSDKEIFGPLLQVIAVDTLEEAVTITNKTQYGLAAGIITESKEKYDYFLNNTRAGIINWNQPLTGSTTIAPFGGIKGSGNYRPAGYLSVDYCVYACASIESQTANTPKNLSPGLDF